MTDQSDVLRPVEQYFAALNAGDAAAMQQLFEPDGKIMPPAKDTVIGRDAIGAFFRSNFANVEFHRDLHVHDVTWDGGLGAVQCSTTGTVTVRATGKTQNVDSREIFLVRRREGNWRIQCYMFNPPNEASVH